MENNTIITITDAAARKLHEFIGQSPTEDKDRLALRVSVIGGGCSGLQYKMGIEEVEAGDAVLINGVRVTIDKKSALYLAGAEIDYLDGLMESGFKITNPNAKTTCGCGSSFR